MTKILTISASNSSKSINSQLLAFAVEKISGHQITNLDIRDYPLPFYSSDREETDGFPENAKKVLDLFTQTEAFILASPEHNGSIPAEFKNMIDWISRMGESGVPMFGKKPVLLLSTSPGPRGGSTNLQNLSKIMPFWGADIRGTHSVGSFYDHFSDGKLDEEQDQLLSKVISEFTSGL